MNLKRDGFAPGAVEWADDQLEKANQVVEKLS